MLVGPDILVTLAPHSGSRSLARRLASEATRPQTMRTGTHIGLWDGVEQYPARRMLGATRDPVAWHVAHFGHWCRGASGADRLAPWMPRARALLARAAAHKAGTIQRAAEETPGLLPALWAAYVDGVTAPAAAGLDLDARPAASSWPATGEQAAPARWMHERGAGLATWGYVRQFYPRDLWGLSLDDLERSAGRMYADALIDCAQLDAGLSEVAYVWGLTLSGEAGPGASAAPRVLVEPTEDQARRIRHAERLIYRLHPGYLTGDAPPVLWTRAEGAG